ncbi:MAG: peptidoglycan-binding protein [Proteobacteria bacterium]|nr:peptidoglycan-binding protein [Pseudomonadota bacterium]
MRTFSGRITATAIAAVLGLAVALPGAAWSQQQAGAATPAAKAAAPAKPAAKRPAKAQKSDPKVVAVQEALNKAGAKLKVDGMMGKATTAALRDYQKKNGLKVTGKTDDATRQKLQLP